MTTECSTAEHEALRLERLRLRLSQFEIALQTRIPPRRISAFENGYVNLSADEIARLRDALAHAGGAV